MQHSFDSLDITSGPFGVHSRVFVTGKYLSRHFSLPKKERNLETVYEMFKKGEVKRTFGEGLFLEASYYCLEYKKELLNMLSRDFYAARERHPQWERFLAGESIRLKDNRISMVTTTLNFTNLESFVLKFLELQIFPTAFMDHQADIQIDYSTLHIENMSELFKDKYYFDEFERVSQRYTFDICFELLITLKNPVKPTSPSLKKYIASRNTIQSTHFAQIVCDMLAYPNRLQYSTKSDKTFLKPQTLEEAQDYFCKRYAQAHKSTVAAKKLSEKIMIDPLSYIDDKDEIISDFANALLTGI